MSTDHTTGDDPAPLLLADLETAARAVLSPGAYDYIAGGATEETTLVANAAAWRRIAILPHVLTGAANVDRSTTLLGVRLPHPLIVAPMAYQRLATHDGEMAMAAAAAATGTIFCISTLSTVSATDVAAAVPESRRWYQVYVFTDRDLTHAAIEAALDAGYSALVLTVDFPVSGLRDRDHRSGFVVGDATTIPAVAATGERGVVEPHQVAALVDAHLTWSDVSDMASRYRVPLLLKGILTSEDARRAVDHGAAGIVVSNHGGRQLDGMPATADVLPAIVDAVGDTTHVVVDGGLRRGTDVLRALALGADAVMIGRPLYWGLALAGSAGAQAVIESLLNELDNALVLCGAGSVAHLDRTYLMR